jgi:hypothetical protein
LDTTGLNTEWKVVEREQDSGERGRREAMLLQMNDVVGNKLWLLEKIFMTDLEG